MDTERPMSDLDLDDIYRFAVQLGKDAGALLQSAAQARINGRTQSTHVEKESAVDLVTQTGTACIPEHMLDGLADVFRCNR